MTDQLPAISGLTQDEAEYIYNVEYLQLPARRAALMAGMSIAKINAPHITQAREMAKREIRGSTQITKEDVIWGMREAVGRAQILSEPMTEIVGWKEIAKLLGYDAPQKIDVNITASIEALQSAVRGMSDAELARTVGAGGIIDVDFYQTDK